MQILRRSFCLTLIGILVFNACRSVPDETPPAKATSSGRALAQRIIGVEGLENFAQVREGLYRGAQPSEEGFRRLKAMGVKTVIGLREYHPTRKQVEAAGLVSVELPIRANAYDSEPPTEEQIRRFFKVVLDPAQGPVYFHCLHGKDRTGTMGALYRIEVDGWANEEAIEEMRSFGYHTYYKDLIKFVRAYTPRGYAKGSAR
ncbi:MAG TPA: tyrosine-protein phosphatase [Planctomycetota bacterium]|nr:tyrosine-protein phosphatase [Planctomycetota bacterium]